ncbi:hypothetical protein [Streptomyces daghestanicus]|uniref:Uncharacterized protein n=1 Tax=Streptomyces daghestanicus TaxID=66885 RepID=A0ABQ3QD84_9ACTN|nr:hypothetical protein [Streptomyces daghestanicus]GGU15674.1 hypothetical protein GCM10010259_02450 [Streptomyces daghestanicus]GHI35226.1 hypothetical protein Sdagh_69560 [Streptomyces daghestanicus]
MSAGLAAVAASRVPGERGLGVDGGHVLVDTGLAVEGDPGAASCRDAVGLETTVG